MEEMKSIIQQKHQTKMTKYIHGTTKNGVQTVRENPFYRERIEKVEAIAGGLIILALIIIGISLI